MEALPKILYIDDEPENLVGFKISFSKNFTIYTAENTAIGYELMKSNEFSVVLVDYKMPQEDGVSFIERIKDEFKQIVFIVISGYADLEIVIKAINMNCLNNFVQKPWNYNELKIVLNNAVETYQIKKENKMLLEMLLMNNKQLEESIDRERKLNDLKNVFLQNISHEIRTPLNSIMGYANIARDETIDANIKSHLNICIQSGYKLLKVVEDIILASMIITDQVKTDVGEFHISTLVSDVMRNRDAKCLNTPSIKFMNEIDSNICVINDKDKIRTALELLIDNAYKFTETGFIIVSAEVDHSEESVIVHVHDSGIGILPEKQQIIFEPFRQSDESSIRRFGGNGLGLFITKSFIEMLGGRVWCASALEKGSVFSFSVKRRVV